MLLLLVIIAAGILLAFLAGQNSSIVAIHAGGYEIAGIPLYVLVFASFFVGVFISWVISAFGLARHKMNVMGKDHEITAYQKQMSDLKNQIAKLEDENAQLRGDKEELHEEKQEIVDEQRASWWNQFRNRVTPTVS